MDDRVLVWLAGTVAVVGLVLLLFAGADEQDRFVLHGTVSSVAGSRATVDAQVSLVMRGAHVGDVVHASVFWDGSTFVAVDP